MTAHLFTLISIGMLMYWILWFVSLVLGFGPKETKQQPGERGITHALREGTKLTVVPTIRLFVWLFTKKPSNEEKR